MLEETATVIAARDGRLLVESESHSACSHCGSGGSCGTSVVSQLFGSRRNRLELENTLGAQTGERVVIGIPDEILVQASVTAYLLPLLIMTLSAAAAESFGMSEGEQIVSALGGLVGGFFLVRRFSRGAATRRRFQARLLRVLGRNHETVTLIRSQT